MAREVGENEKGTNHIHSQKRREQAASFRTADHHRHASCLQHQAACEGHQPHGWLRRANPPCQTMNECSHRPKESCQLTSVHASPFLPLHPLSLHMHHWFHQHLPTAILRCIQDERLNPRLRPDHPSRGCSLKPLHLVRLHNGTRFCNGLASSRLVVERAVVTVRVTVNRAEHAVTAAAKARETQLLATDVAARRG